MDPEGGGIYVWQGELLAAMGLKRIFVKTGTHQNFPGDTEVFS